MKILPRVDQQTASSKQKNKAELKTRTKTRVKWIERRAEELDEDYLKGLAEVSGCTMERGKAGGAR